MAPPDRPPSVRPAGTRYTSSTRRPRDGRLFGRRFLRSLGRLAGEGAGRRSAAFTHCRSTRSLALRCRDDVVAPGLARGGGSRFWGFLVIIEWVNAARRGRGIEQLDQQEPDSTGRTQNQPRYI